MGPRYRISAEGIWVVERVEALLRTGLRADIAWMLAEAESVQRQRDARMRASVRG